MIYVIKVEYKDIDLLKIGYTKDENKDSRFTQYKMHNPLYQVIYEIPGADRDKEKALQDLFSCYRYKGKGKSREWFEYNEEIVDYFSALKKKYETRVKEDRENFETILNKALDMRAVSDNRDSLKEKLISSKEDIINLWEVMEYGLLGYFLGLIDKGV